MKLYTHCNHCNTNIPVSSKGVLLRRDLEYTYGESVSVKCPRCQNIKDAHPNQVFAKSSKLPMIVCVVIGGLFIFFGIIIFFTNSTTFSWPIYIGGFIITAGLLSLRNTSATAFNKSYI